MLASDSEYGRGEVETQERLNELKELDEGSISGRSGRSLSQEDLGGAMNRQMGQVGVLSLSSPACACTFMSSCVSAGFLS